MKKSFSNDVKVGLFIIFGFAALLYLSMNIGDIPFISKKAENSFYIYFNTVTGIGKKTNVLMQGVKIGEVGEVKLEKRKVRLTIFLDKPVNIPVDSIGTIQGAGLLGDRHLNIQPGMSDKFIGKGDTMAYSVDPTNIDTIMSKLSSALDDVKKFSKGLGALFDEGGIVGLFGEGGLLGEGGKLTDIMDRIDEASGLIVAMLKENRENLKAGVGNVKNVSAHLDEILLENRGNIKESVNNIRNVTAKLEDVIGDNRENFKDTLANLKSGSAKLDTLMVSLNRVMDKVEKGEGTIGKLVQEDTVYDNLNRTLAGAQGFVAKVDRIRIGVGFRVEEQEALGESKSYFSLRIKPREDKFYLLEISEDIRRKDIQTRNTLNSLLYTILFNKRYGNINLKAGLMESTGGIGMDYYLWRDSARFTADLFNLGGYDIKSPNPELKISGRYYIQKYIFLYLGGDELFNDAYRSFFAGVGVMADEDDLKFLMQLL